MVAPGMTCQYVVQFIPDCLGDFDDFILVETQSAHTLVIPLQARRPPPVLTCECMHCTFSGIRLGLESPSKGRLHPRTSQKGHRPCISWVEASSPERSLLAASTPAGLHFPVCRGCFCDVVRDGGSLCRC